MLICGHTDSVFQKEYGTQNYKLHNKIFSPVIHGEGLEMEQVQKQADKHGTLQRC